jgi:hypothetical protein
VRERERERERERGGPVGQQAGYLRLALGEIERWKVETEI